MRKATAVTAAASMVSLLVILLPPTSRASTDLPVGYQRTTKVYYSSTCACASTPSGFPTTDGVTRRAMLTLRSERISSLRIRFSLRFVVTTEPTHGGRMPHVRPLPSQIYAFSGRAYLLPGPTYFGNPVPDPPTQLSIDQFGSDAVKAITIKGTRGRQVFALTGIAHALEGISAPGGGVDVVTADVFADNGGGPGLFWDNANTVLSVTNLQGARVPYTGPEPEP